MNATSESRPRLPLSVLIRTLNEADRLAKTLISVQPLDCEIVVIDAGSKDDTAAIAKAHGAVVVTNPWPGFGPQRYFGEEKCSNDFVFSLDADEILTPEMVAEIRSVFLAGSPPPLMIVRKAFILPHRERPTPWPFCHEQILIYDRRVARTNPHPNWDKLDIAPGTPPPIKIKNPLWHYSLRDHHHAVAKLNYTSQLAADTIPRQSRALLLLRLVTEFPLTFFKFYFLRRYVLAGADGFVAAMTGAFSRFIRIAKMLERRDYGERTKT